MSQIATVPHTFTFLSWNVQVRQKDETDADWASRQIRIETAIVDWVQSYNVDVVVLIESQLSDNSLTARLKTFDVSYKAFLPHSGRRPQMYTRMPATTAQFPAGPRQAAVLLSTGWASMPYLTVVAVHLPSKLHSGQDDQDFTCRILRNDLDLWPATAPSGNSTIVIGDFNLDPFERGMVAHDGFHAVSSGSISLNTNRICQGRTARHRYNPCWSLLGDSIQPPGTYYFNRSGKVLNPYWHVFDQVLLDPELVTALKSPVKILTQHGLGTSLLNESGVPDRIAYSDHLPILFSLQAQESDA